MAHYMVPDDEACLARIRQLIRELPGVEPGCPAGSNGDPEEPTPPVRDPTEIYEILPDDHRQPYDMYAVPGVHPGW